MNQLFLQQHISGELRPFPHIRELGARKNISIQLNSFPVSPCPALGVYVITEGKFQWMIGSREYLLYPGDVAIVLPGREFGSSRGLLEIGSYSWIQLSVQLNSKGLLLPLRQTHLSKAEQQAISKILSLHEHAVLVNFTEAGRVIHSMQHELMKQEIGFQTRVCQLTDELLITITRHLTRQNHQGRDFPQAFLNLEEALRQNLSHQWTVEEMAALVGMGATVFNEKVKSYTGFTPINYLINIRIAEAIKLLRKPDISLTDIALDTGFYSSQHFSTTFKKLTGYTPSEFRKNHLHSK
jgi:AraC-like DNA-binding protein